MRNIHQIKQELKLECADGTIQIPYQTVMECDYFAHLIHGQEKLNQIGSTPTFTTLKCTKLYPSEIIMSYFCSIVQDDCSELGSNIILQILGFLFSDGRGEIYNTQKRAINKLCVVLQGRCGTERHRNLVNQILTLASFSEASAIEETILFIRRFVDIHIFNEYVQEFSEDTLEFTHLPSLFTRALTENELTFGIRTRHARHLTHEDIQIDIITFIGQVYSYFKFLFPFDKFTFTNCHSTGFDGPDNYDCVKAYDAYWAKDTSYFTMARRGYQIFTVPETSHYSLELHGAGYANGFGAVITDSCYLQLGDKLTIVIGQQGSNGGCGGSYIELNGTLLMVAGGGGRHSNNMKPKGMKSKGGKGCFIRGGGGGYEKNGQIGIARVETAKSFKNGATGGIADNSDRHFGGFGGGGYCGGGGGYYGGNADFAHSSHGSSFSVGDHPVVKFESISHGKLLLKKTVNSE